MNTTANISPMVPAMAQQKMLKRMIPNMVIEPWGQVFELPQHNSKNMKFRRYLPLDATPVELTEGVAPSGEQLKYEEITCTVQQFGDLMYFSDVVVDTEDSPILTQASEVLGEQAARLLETMRYNILKAGTNVFYANGTQRTDVNTPITRELQRKVERTLRRNAAKPVTKRTASSTNYGTEAVDACFIALCHVDCSSDIRDMKGFKDVIDYGSRQAFPYELGSVEGVRYITSPILEPWANAGGDAGTMLSTDGVKADVYPILFIAEDAFGIVPLRGHGSLKPQIVNGPDMTNPLNQKCAIGWKTMQTCVILNQNALVRAEVAATA